MALSARIAPSPTQARTRRVALACTAIFVASLALASGASAVGPGGWNHVGTGSTPAMSALNGPVYALNTDNPGVLLAGGAFTSAGGNANAQRIARWNGSAWSALGSTPLSNGSVLAIAYAAGKTYIGGTFINVGGNPNIDFLAVWNGATWASPCTSTVPGPAITANVESLKIIGNSLYVGGAFANGAGLDAADFLVRCDLTTGIASPTVDSVAHAFGGDVAALTADRNGVLYAGGGFLNLESIPAADHVAYYDGTWHAMGSGPGPGGAAIDDHVRSLTASGTNVYVGTDALNIAGIANADHIARWNGAAWSAVGHNTAATNGWFPTTAFIDALTTYGSIVVAAGSFQNANGIAAADQIAYFDGTTWRPVGSDGAGNGPLNAHPVSLGVTGGKVYAGGNFTSAGGDTLGKYVASYALRQPDALIAASSAGTYIGNNIYSSTGVSESLLKTITRGHSAWVYLRIQNDGLVAATFKLKGTGGASGITAHYYAGTTNITLAVLAGTYTTATIAARGYVTIRLLASVASSSAATRTLMTTVTSTSGTPSDAVRLVVKAG
jgi:hypothetical protein